MSDNKDSITYTADKFDVSVVLDFLMVIGTGIADTSISDEEFRSLVKAKFDNLAFLVESGIITTTDEQTDFVMSILEEDND